MSSAGKDGSLEAHETAPLFKADNATLSFYATNQRDLSGMGYEQDCARTATVCVTWGQGQVEARIVERRRPQSSHGSTKTVRCAVIGWGHLSRASVIVVRICDENSALAPAPALEAMEADLP